MAERSPACDSLDIFLSPALVAMESRHDVATLRLGGYRMCDLVLVCNVQSGYVGVGRMGDLAELLRLRSSRSSTVHPRITTARAHSSFIQGDAQ